ncbi:hypothetical protein EB118_00435 [bacterium]|nr:hypothetical protein [bacterium]
MAQIEFYANILNGANTLINHSAGSGLGFYGSSFGVSVPVNAKQTTTYVTDANGVNQGSQLNNTSMSTLGNGATAGTVSINSNTAINNNNLPNYLCPLNVRFTHNEAVRVQNCKLRIFDRSNINNPASGVTTYVYEARHPSSLQNKTNLSHRGRNDNSWVEFDPVTSVTDMIFTSSPGISGTNTNTSDTDTSLGYLTQNGSLHSSTRHDWYIALSSEPESIGSKTQYGLYFSVEYL